LKKKLTFGYLYDFRNPTQWRRPWGELYAETLDLIALTEQLGFEGVWVPEHHNSEDGYLPSPLSMLGAIAARTKRMKLGTAIALAPLYHPVRFAEDCAVLDILSQGRLEMAVAVGYRRRETDALGVPFNSRGTRTDEFIQIVRRRSRMRRFSRDRSVRTSRCMSADSVRKPCNGRFSWVMATTAMLRCSMPI
jgi:alkanesulfonate monooxygenase SsuD/methylene tetrahydromethanopterin reductase-like flavin-dependent oxidoreductase (luciferase family)